MIVVRGFLEVLQMADSTEPKSFDAFTTISISKKLSSATISKRLNELIAIKTIEEVVNRSKAGRRVIAYKTTEKGKRVIRIVQELQDALVVSKAR